MYDSVARLSPIPDRQVAQLAIRQTVPRTVVVSNATDDFLRESFRSVIKLLNFPPSLSSIGIKLNLCDYRLGSSGATSRIEVVRAMVNVLREFYPGCKVTLIEHHSSGTDARDLFRMLGFESLAVETGCALLSLADTKWREVEVPASRALRSIKVSEAFDEFDFWINHPKLKVHGKTHISIALKNLFGCLEPKWKVPFHDHLDEVIVDINKVLRPHVSIVDGTISLLNWGPTYGVPVRTNVLIGGTDPVSVDAECARLIGIHPRMIRHLRLARKDGLGKITTEHARLKLNCLPGLNLDWARHLIVRYGGITG